MNNEVSGSVQEGTNSNSTKAQTAVSSSLSSLEIHTPEHQVENNLTIHPKQEISDGNCVKTADTWLTTTTC